MLPWPAILLTLLIFSSASADRPEALDENISSSVQIIPKKPDKNERLTAIYTLKKEKIVNAVTAYFKNALAKKQVSGAGVSIVKGDSILFTEGFGKRKATLKDNINAQTVFRLGSLSKGFAGVLAGMYVNDGLLRWDSKIEDYVDGFQLGSLENSSQITLAKILSHTSGTPYHSYTKCHFCPLRNNDRAGFGPLYRRCFKRAHFSTTWYEKRLNGL